MRKLFPFFLLLFCPLVWAVNPALGVHNLHSVQGGSNSTVTTTGVTTQASGSSFIAAAVLGGTLTGVTISDSFSNSWGTAIKVQEANDGGWIYVWVVTNGAGGASHTLTVGTGGLGSVFDVNLIEITNSTSFTSGSGYTVAATNATISVTPTGSNNLIAVLGYSAIAPNKPLTTTGYTQIDQNFWATTNAESYAADYLTGASSSAQTPPITNGDAALAIVALAFAPVAAASPSTMLLVQ